MPSLNHTHKYKKIATGKNKDWIVYQCVLNCSHNIRPEFIVGKLSICWKCGQEFELTKTLLKVKPTCQTCKTAKPKELKGPADNDKVLEGLGFKI